MNNVSLLKKNNSLVEVEINSPVFDVTTTFGNGEFSDYMVPLLDFDSTYEKYNIFNKKDLNSGIKYNSGVDVRSEDFSFHSLLGNGSLPKKTIPLIELESIIEDVILTSEFSRLNKSQGNDIYLADNTHEVLKVMKLRSRIYTAIGYNDEFPEKIKGLNYDEFDRDSFIFVKKEGKDLIGSLRIIQQKENGRLQSFDIYPELSDFCSNHKVGEISRVVVDPQYRNQGYATLLLKKAAEVSRKLDFNYLLVGCLEEHIPFYGKIGKLEILYRGEYGKIEKKCVISAIKL